MLIIFPPPRLIMWRPASWAIRKTLERFTSITVAQSSAEYSVAAARRIVPALLTRISSWPKCSIVFSINRRGVSLSPRSPVKEKAFRPALVTAAQLASGACVLPWQATFAPASASAIAMAAPNPVDAPVTKAALPSSLNVSRMPINRL